MILDKINCAELCFSSETRREYEKKSKNVFLFIISKEYHHIQSHIIF